MKGGKGSRGSFEGKRTSLIYEFCMLTPKYWICLIFFDIIWVVLRSHLFYLLSGCAQELLVLLNLFSIPWYCVGDTGNSSVLIVKIGCYQCCLCLGERFGIDISKLPFLLERVVEPFSITLEQNVFTFLLVVEGTTGKVLQCTMQLMSIYEQKCSF